MSAILSPEPAAKPDLGRLANNGMTVMSLQTALSKADMDVRLIPKLICRVEKDQAWRSFIIGQWADQIHQWNAADFRAFIESPRPRGCQTPVHVLERIVRDTDAWPVFLKLMRGLPGENAASRERSSDGTFASPGCDNITPWTEPTDDAPVSIPIPIPVNRKPPTGTSVSYRLRQLEYGTRIGGVQLPPRPDLLEKVKVGELTPHAAAVEAGFCEKQITIPVNPVAAARRLARHFTPDELVVLGDLLKQAARDSRDADGGPPP